MADLPLLGDELRRRLALERDRQLGIDPGAGNDRGYAFNQWLPVSTNKVGSASWVQQGADPKLAVPEALQGGLLGGADLLDSTRTGKLTPEALGSLLTGAMMGGGLLAPRGSLASGGSIKGYHASPHDFDKFELRPGTGEGTAAFGHGVYIGENPAVAEEYLRQFKEAGRGGHTYEVKINADPKRIIDDDLPLQRSGVPMDVIERWREAKTPEERTKILQDAGFQGKKYLDQGSRGGGSGTYNYVVFDPSIIEILRKYGLAAPSPVVPSAQGAPTTPGLLSNQQSEIPMKDRVY